MTNNEFRVGNLVKSTSPKERGAIKKIIAISEHGVAFDQLSYQFIWSPFEKINCIPLTPEILEACGFKSDNGIFKQAFSKGGIILKEFNHGYEYVSSGGAAYFKNKYYHLHELQNLFYSLTGEELKYKPATELVTIKNESGSSVTMTAEALERLKELVASGKTLETTIKDGQAFINFK